MKFPYSPLLVVLLGGLAPALPQRTVIQDAQAQLEWRESGVWLSGDIHIHRLLNESHGEAIAREAARSALDFIAATDHPRRGISELEAARLAELRARYPEMVVFAGAEWNVPGGDHASIVIEIDSREIDFLNRFLQRFDRDGESRGELWQAEDGLRWLDQEARLGAPRSVVYLNHISRHDYLDSAQIGRLMRAGLAGIEAAPGHQKRDHPGEPRTVDRHEPFVIEIGGGFDELLAGGTHVGIVAGSDFHQEATAFYPGEFSRTDVFCPDRTPEGILRGLRAGATVTVVGDMVQEVTTRLMDHDLKSMAWAGMSETLVVARGSGATYRIRFVTPRKLDFGGINRIDRLEIVSDCLGSPEVIATFEKLGDGETLIDFELPAQATERVGSCYLRARGRRELGDERHDMQNADLLFHTTATYLRVVEPPHFASSSAQRS